ncbi:hypothetical protein PPGU19_077030 (plasmid) [Paraburkholderia sp. PGU19]|nr:hypothetical protein PPGU19_077030 [Paraburkholderia sp. PGU19]
MLTREAIPQVLSRTSELLSADNLEGAPQKTFHHVIDIYLKDSNAFMNTYFARYFEWQGVCRERWFHECIHNNLLAAGAPLSRNARIRNTCRRRFRFSASTAT